MTNPQPNDGVTRVRLPLPLAVAVKTAAAQRGVTVSDVIRQALANDLAQLPKKAQPAQ